MFSRNRSRLHPRLSIESLEDRQMMAGDVAASLVNGTLFINEAVGSEGGVQTVQVTQLPSGNIRLTGLTAPANHAGSKVNGQKFVEFSQVNNIQANLGGGPDNISFFGSGNFMTNLIFDVGDHNGGTNDNDIVQLFNARTTGTVNVRTSSGQDLVRIQDSIVGSQFSSINDNNLFITTGVGFAEGDTDKDAVFLEGTKVSGFTSISTGASDDVLTIKNSDLGFTASKTVTIDTGAGADNVTLGSGPGELAAVGASGDFRLITGADNQDDADVVHVQDLFVDGNMIMQFGGGDDQLSMVNAQSRKDITLQGMKGNDVMTLTEVEAFDRFLAEMGEGSDALDLTFVKAQHLKADGGAGFDKLSRHQSPQIADLVLTGWEQINGVLTKNFFTSQLDVAGTLTRSR